MTYLVVNDTEDRGVYRFDSRGVAEKIATNFKNYVFMHEDELDKALALAGVSETTDALFLIRKYNSKKNKEEREVAKEKKEVVVAKEEKVEKKTEKASKEHTFIKLFNKLKESGDTIRITLKSGEDYVVSTKSYFIAMKDVPTMLCPGDVPTVNELVVDNAIKTHAIVCLPKTKIEYVENYMILTDCDDKYSPNHKDAPFAHYEHEYSKVAINMDDICSAAVIANFDFGSNQIITSEIVVKYLVRHML